MIGGIFSVASNHVAPNDKERFLRPRGGFEACGDHSATAMVLTGDWTARAGLRTCARQGLQFVRKELSTANLRIEPRLHFVMEIMAGDRTMTVMAKPELKNR